MGGFLNLNRRRFLQGTAATAFAGTSGIRLAQAADVTLGIVYVGPRDDFGWNQAHAVAAKALKSIPGIKVVEEENVPETDACAKTMESMINLDGAKIVLGTSFGYYSPFMVDMAKKHSGCSCVAPLLDAADPKNLGSYSASTKRTTRRRRRRSLDRRTSSVVPLPISSVLSTSIVHARAKSTNPNATVQVIFTGDWSPPVRGPKPLTRWRRRLRRRHLPRDAPGRDETASAAQTRGHNAL